jgi:hypothetical protein
MSLRYIRSGRQAKSKFAVSRLQIILREPLSDLAGCTTDNGILIGIVVGFPIENIDAESALFQAIEAAIDSGLDDMPKEPATLLARMKLVTLENPFEFG